jgi:hypothetical protein
VCGHRFYTQHQLETLPVSDAEYAEFMKPFDCNCRWAKEQALILKALDEQATRLP